MPGRLSACRVAPDSRYKQLQSVVQPRPTPPLPAEGHCHVGQFYLSMARRAYGPHTANQWLAEFESGAGHLENPLFLADVTTPVPRPPTRTQMTTTAACGRLKTSGLMKFPQLAKSAPARPASAQKRQTRRVSASVVAEQLHPRLILPDALKNATEGRPGKRDA
jgi:hypothetical protein